MPRTKPVRVRRRLPKKLRSLPSSSQSFGCLVLPQSYEESQTDAHTRFSVQSFEPQVEGSSSDIVVSVCLAPEGPSEILFEDTWILHSSPPQSSRSVSFHSAPSSQSGQRQSFHSATSSIVRSDGASDIPWYSNSYNASEASMSSRRARLNFRIGNENNPSSSTSLNRIKFITLLSDRIAVFFSWKQGRLVRDFSRNVRYRP